MGFTVAPKITVPTAEGPIIVKNTDIIAIAIAADLGSNIMIVKDGYKKTVLTVKSFLWVISYFNR